MPFRRRIARRQYVWRPPAGRRREVDVEIGTPVRVAAGEWACRFRINGLPTPIDKSAHGIDALQALELALIGAGRLLSQSPQFRAGQIEMWGKLVSNAAELFLPLPMNSLQGTLENLRAFLERQRQKQRTTGRNWFAPEWGRALLSAMNEINGNLATLAAHLPIPLAAKGTDKSRGRRQARGAAGKSRRPRPFASRKPRNR